MWTLRSLEDRAPPPQLRMQKQVSSTPCGAWGGRGGGPARRGAGGRGSEEGVVGSRHPTQVCRWHLWRWRKDLTAFSGEVGERGGGRRGQYPRTTLERRIKKASAVSSLCTSWSAKTTQEPTLLVEEYLVSRACMLHPACHGAGGADGREEEARTSSGTLFSASSSPQGFPSLRQKCACRSRSIFWRSRQLTSEGKEGEGWRACWERDGELRMQGAPTRAGRRNRRTPQAARSRYRRNFGEGLLVTGWGLGRRYFFKG